MILQFRVRQLNSLIPCLTPQSGAGRPAAAVLQSLRMLYNPGAVWSTGGIVTQIFIGYARQVSVGVARARVLSTSDRLDRKPGPSMCGIVGYVGPKSVVSVIINGLRKLEYRGYDSAGIAVCPDRQIQIRRSSGKLVNLVGSLATNPGWRATMESAIRRGRHTGVPPKRMLIRIAIAPAELPSSTTGLSKTTLT